MNEKKVQDALLQAIETIIDNKIKNLRFNYYIDAVICNVNSDDNGNNTYDIKYNNVTYRYVPSFQKSQFQVGDVVQVLIKNGDWNKKFIDDKVKHDSYKLADEIDNLTTDINSLQNKTYTMGDSGIWTYRKWEAGLAECWGVYSYTDTNYLTVGDFGAYKAEDIEFPTGLFTETPLVTYSGSVGSGFCLTGTIVNCTKEKISCYALANTNGSKNCKFYIQATGKWK